MEKTIFMRRLYKYKDLLFFICLIAVYLIWSFDNFFRPAQAGLDPSWMLGLNWVRNIGVQWGNDFIFTYGPLYYFAGCAIPDFFSPKAFLLINFGINLFIAAIKAGVVFLFYRRVNSPYKMYSAIFAGIVMLLCVREHLWIHYLYPELIIMFATMLLCDSYYELCEMVIVQYVKFSFFNIALILIISLSILYIFRRKYKIAVIFAGSYIALSILLWIISGQNIKNLLGYIYTGLQISNGYTSAMNHHFVDSTVFNIFVFAFITIGAFVIILIYFAIKRKSFYFISMLFISPQIFLLFKQSFVRADIHAYSFMGTLPIIVLYLAFVSVLLPPTTLPSSQKSQLFAINLHKWVITIAIIITWVSISVTNVRFLPNNNMYQVLRDYVSYEDRTKESKQYIRNYYNNYNELTHYINTNEKTDIIPYDISLLYAYDLNWQPRPVIQSYANYTPALDKLTARHFITEKAPDKLIYSIQAIDGRYALFDEPETFRTVLTNYSSIADNDTYLILEKKQQVKPVTMKEIHSVTVKTGEIIEVPIRKDAYIFMEIKWDFHLFGKLANFLFKTTYAYIELQSDDDSMTRYRFVHKTAANGLFVSKYVSNTHELKQVFDRDFIPDIAGVRVLGSSLFYKHKVKVKFYEIPF